jgi:acetyl-CoA carboxylase biotin carboxyl carrier protein
VSRPVLPLLVRRDGPRIALGAPKVGVWSDAPAPGTPVAAGSAAGTLTQLTRRYDLRVPPGVSGVVAGHAPRDRALAVEYGQELFEVLARDAIVPAPEAPGAAASAAPGTHRVVAPTDGVFYRAAGPGSPAFAPKGARLTPGQTVGLIEVMKTFNPILYGGGALPESAEVVEVLAGDGEEVRAGQPLLVVR